VNVEGGGYIVNKAFHHTKRIVNLYSFSFIAYVEDRFPMCIIFSAVQHSKM